MFFKVIMTVFSLLALMRIFLCLVMLRILKSSIISTEVCYLRLVIVCLRPQRKISDLGQIEFSYVMLKIRAVAFWSFVGG